MNAGITAGDELLGWCYQECTTSQTETGQRVQVILAYGTSATAVGEPECIPDVDEEWFDAGGVHHAYHHDCYGHCVNWVTVEEGVQVQIPGCAEANNSDCRQPAI